jgi:hypothetical protein
MKEMENENRINSLEAEVEYLKYILSRVNTYDLKNGH